MMDFWQGMVYITIAIIVFAVIFGSVGLLCWWTGKGNTVW